LSLLRFITCGSVDDGKSTLVGRLLHDMDQIPEDQLDAAAASVGGSTGGAGIDLASLMDGLSAEREQGITIDVAYRYFATEKRNFIVADTPGHEQYTRNMVTGASTADVAVVLVDARKGIVRQTRRHLWIAALMGIPRAVMAVNKMDLIGHEEDQFRGIEAEFREIGVKLGFTEAMAVPVSALDGGNVAKPSADLAWFKGPTLLSYLETAPARSEASERFRMPVQWVNRTAPDFRGFAGTIASGLIRPGDGVRILPGAGNTRVELIVSLGGNLEQAVADQSVTLTFCDQVDCARGNLIVAADDPLEAADQFEAAIVWMDEQPLLPGRSYLLKIGAATVGAVVTELKYEIDVESGEHVAAKTLTFNGIGVANLALDQPLGFTSYSENRALGGFILIDRISNATAGAGMINFALRRSQNVHWQHISVDRDAHAALKGQRSKVVWLTGLSGAGKSTIGNLVEKKLHALGRHSFLLDGDNLRHGLNKDLGFSDADRVENIRRAGEVAKIMADAGLIVLCAFISPFRAERRMIREMLPPGDFIEVFLDVPLEEAERRDPKGLYRKARAGLLPNFTGIDSPYEAPEHAELRLDTTVVSAEAAADLIVEAALA